VCGSDEFLVRELFGDDAAALRLVLAGENATSVGRLVKRADGQAIDGYMVESRGSELHRARHRHRHRGGVEARRDRQGIHWRRKDGP